MTIESWLQDSIKRLSDVEISSARLDCLILLEDELGRDRSWLLAHPEAALTKKQADTLNTKLQQRQRHMPLSYIRGRSEFYGRTFTVNAHTLVPRPETEDIITLLKGLGLPATPVLVDVGTGSGAIAVTAKLELPMAQVYATDIDPVCLQTAATNARQHSAAISTIEADLLSPTAGQTLPAPDVVLANLPYVPDSFQINTAATHEPRLAIFGGPDGLDLYRRMFGQIDALPIKPVYIISEALPPSKATLATIAKGLGYALVATSGFVQLFRFGGLPQKVN